MGGRPSLRFTRIPREGTGKIEVAITELRASAQTDRGESRVENQDCVLSEIGPDNETGLFAVADGMGGQVAGGIASAIAIESLRQELLSIVQDAMPSREDEFTFAETVSETDVPLTVRLHNAIIRCNDDILAYADMHPEAQGMGSTLTVALVKGSLAIIGNIGDSRTYRIRNREIETLTHDHSLVAHLAAIGQIQPEDVYSHPQRSIIYRALGSEEDVQPDIFTERLHSGDTLLLCSDGLWEMIRDDVLLDMIDENKPLEEMARQLVAAANANGGNDNISVILVRAS